MEEAWIRADPGFFLNVQHSSGMVKFGGESLMLWDCMTPQ